MQNLNLPTFDCKISEIDGKPHIFDVVRRKHLLITPEEWVRQHLLHWLMNEHAYPRTLIKIEGGLRYNKLAKRSDLIVYDHSGQPFLLVECKAPHIPLSEAVFAQAARYNAIIKARYLLISNGLEHFVFEVGQAELLTALNGIPVLV